MRELRIEKKQVFAVSDNETFIRCLSEVMMPFASTEGVSFDADTLIQQLGTRRSALVFVDMQDNAEAALTLAQRVRKVLPDVPVFLLGQEKDPDLIIQGLRMGITDFFILSGGDDLLRTQIVEALDRLTGTDTQGEIYSVFSIPGGHGVTTLAIHLAESIAALSGRRTLLSDMNLYLGNVSSALECRTSCTPFELVRELSRLDDSLLFSLLTQHPAGFFLLGNDSDAQDADAISGEDVSRLLMVLKSMLDYIVVDLPHDLTPRTTAILEQSDILLLLVQQNTASLRSAQGVLALCEELGYGEEKVKVVLNRFLPRHALGRKEIEEALRHPVHTALPNDFARVSDAQNRGATLGQTAPGAALCRHFEELASRLTGIPAQRSHGFWGSFLQRSSLARFLT